MKFALLTLIMLVPLASAQKLELKLDAIAAKASGKSVVDLDGTLLRLVRGLSRLDRDARAVGDLLSGVQEVHVRNYQFDTAGAYSPSDLDALRKQASEAAGWSRILNVQLKDENTEIFVNMQGGKAGGFLIVAAEAREVSVVYLLGTLTLAQVKALADSDVGGNLIGLAAMAGEK